ncbi:MAG: KH domain-containing protein [Lachnospiraceae bacterium]|nr:KH domain-containing protein [Lachnospiraceae bacterium]
MSQEYIEITEKTVDDAITTACQRLSVTSNRLDYIVVQREKSGFLGIGAKPAIIKARVKDAADATQAILDDVIDKAEKKIQKELNGKSPEKKEIKDSAPAAKEETKASKKAEKEVKSEKKDAEKTEKKELKEKDKEGKKNNKKNKKKSSAPKKAEAEAPAAAASAAPVEEKAAPAPKKKAVIPQLTDEKIAEIKKAAHDFLVGVFKTMDMNVEISEEYQKETGILTVNMEGDDMGVLIGKRGQTLDSLQYLVSLVVNKDVDGYIHVKADTENYRERRKKTLENLAKNIAFKVKRTRQPVALEPMNPYERRIIHSALQDEKFITTYSEGEEPYRKVVVALKKDENGEDLLKEERFEKGGRGRNGRGRNGRGRKGRDYRGKDNRRGSDRSTENNSKPESEE